MEFYILLVFVCGFVAMGESQHDHHNHENHWVNVSVYYESLCPDSKKFFTQQLYPSLQGNLSNFVNLTLVPYGKSTSKLDITDWNFECHHGEVECYGNKIQACALNLIDMGKSSKGLGFNKVAAGFINCLMDRADKTAAMVFPAEECALINPVSNLQDIKNCANHTDASNYLFIYGKMTDAVQKPLQSVPTILFNNQFKQADNDLAQVNFVKALCQYIQGDKPAECSKAGTITFSLALIMLSVLFTFY